MKFIRKCLRAVGMLADGFEISFAAAVAFLSTHLALYCAHLVTQGWKTLAFPIEHWAKYEIVLAWLQGAVISGRGPLILKTWGIAGLCGLFSVIALLAAYEAFTRMRARFG